MNPLNVVRTVFFLVVFNFSENQVLNSSAISSNQQSTNGTPLSVEIRCSSSFCIHNLTYTWAIRYFSLYEKLDFFESPHFSAATNANDCCIWRILLKPTDKCNQMSFSLFLEIESKIERVVGKNTVTLLNTEGQQVWSSSESTDQFIRGGDGSFHSIYKGGDFRNKCVQNDTLIISYKLSYYIPCTSPNRISCQQFQSNTTTTPEFNTVGNDIVEHLESLFENPTFTDIAISVNGKKFLAHKSILATRSVIFADLISETQTTDIFGRTLLSITDMDEEVAGEVLRYIYTGKCKNLNKLAKGLLVAADKYALAPLKKICAEMISKSLSVENAADLLAFADTYGSNELKAQVIEFIVEHSTQVLNSAAWKSMVPSNSKLVNEVCQALVHFFSGNLKDKNNIRKCVIFSLFNTQYMYTVRAYLFFVNYLIGVLNYLPNH